MEEEQLEESVWVTLLLPGYTPVHSGLIALCVVPAWHPEFLSPGQFIS